MTRLTSKQVLAMSVEELAAVLEERAAAKAAYMASPEARARARIRDRERGATPERKAYNKAHASSPEGKAQRAAYEASSKRKAYLEEYQIKNAEKIKAYSDGYRATPKGKAIRAAYTASPKAKANQAAYRASPAGKVILKKARERRRATKHAEIAQATKVSQHGLCFGCDTELNGDAHLDHIFPVVKGGAFNDLRNLQLLCPRCNLTKNNMHPMDWLKAIGKLK